jgi:hypothetical protein
VPGLQYRVSGRDPESGKSFIVSIWDTREQAEAGVQAVNPDTLDKLATMGHFNEEKYVMEVVHEFNGRSHLERPSSQSS